MQDEIEAKFLDLDHDIVRSRLHELGAVLEQPMRLMRRTLFDYPDMRLNSNDFGRIRVRDEGDKLTVTFKREQKDGYSKEVETTIGSYDKMIELFEAIELKAYCVEESKRETWHYNDVEVVLDEWPHLKTYIEVEGPSEAAIKTCVSDLGLDWNDAVFGNVDAAYRADYPGMKKNETIASIPELYFDKPMPDWLKDRRE